MDKHAKLHDRLNDLIHTEVASTKGHAEQIAERIKETRAVQKTVLHELARAGDIEDLLKAERRFLTQELETLANSPEMTASLNNAIEDLDAAARTLERARDPEAYRGVAESYSRSRNRRRGLPQDEARQFFKSHLTRLGNLGKGRLSDSERDVLSARKQNINTAQQLYVKLQERAMGIIETTTGAHHEDA